MPSYSDQMLGIIIAAICAGGAALLIRFFSVTAVELLWITGLCFVPLSIVVLTVAWVNGFWKS